MLCFRFIIPCLLLTACSTPLRINIPALRFESPELNGAKERSEIAFGFQSYNQAELSADSATIPVHSDPVKLDQYFTNEPDSNIFEALGGIFTDYSYLYLKASHALEIPIELSLRFPDRLGLKLQVLGPRADGAKRGDVSLAISGSMASRSSSETYIKISRKIIDAALIAGVRVSDTWLLYGGPFLLHSPYDVDQETLGVSGTSGQINSYGANLGLQYRHDNGFSLKFEILVNRIEAYKAQEDFINAGFVLAKSF